MKRYARAGLWMILSLFAATAQAHKPSDSYLSMTLPAQGAVLQGQWDIAARDLEHAIGLDVDGDTAITWGELKSRQASLVAYAFSHLSLESTDGGVRRACPIRFEQLLTDQHVDGGYAVLRFSAACPARPTKLVGKYTLLFDLDPDHRGLLDLRSGGSSEATVFSRNHPVREINVGDVQRWSQFRSFVAEGVWHILHGYDHVLFLLTLLLPAVVLYRQGRWEPRGSLRDAALDVVSVVTAFTLAHSLTLSLAVLGVVNVPSRLVESAIAFTVVLGAVNNAFPVVTRRRWLVAFAFGLIHGLGFASVLRDLGLARSSLALALFGFNVGVEIGQLTIVLVLVPIAYWLRATAFYRRVFMPAGAAAIGGIAAYWFVIRAFAW
ncbi:MAG: HupE/UreJ family protein [Steroidobacteraceae bacterium]